MRAVCGSSFVRIMLGKIVLAAFAVCGRCVVPPIFPPWHSNESDQYVVAGDDRELVQYRRDFDHSCTYSKNDSSFGCSRIPVDVPYINYTLRCGICDSTGWPPSKGWATFCKKDGTARMSVMYNDRECWSPHLDSVQVLPNIERKDTPNCFMCQPTERLCRKDVGDFASGTFWLPSFQCPANLTPSYCTGGCDPTYGPSRQCSREKQPPPCNDSCCHVEGGPKIQRAIEKYYEVRKVVSEVQRDVEAFKV